MHFIEKTCGMSPDSNGSVNAISTYKIKSICYPYYILLLTLLTAAEMFQTIYGRIVAICIWWKLKHFEIINRSDPDYLTRLTFYLTASQRQISGRNSTSMIDKYQEQMLLFLNSNYRVIKKILKPNRFLAKISGSRHIKCVSQPYSCI